MPSTIGYPQKLTKRVSQKRMDEVQKAKQLLEYGKKFRQTEREDEWEGSERRYMGEVWVNSDDTTADYVSVPLAFSTIETIVPFISGGDINFMVEPSSGDSDSIRARYIAVYLNRLWRSHEFDGHSKIRLSTHDYLMYGDGFMEVQFDFPKTYNRNPDGTPVPGSGKERLKISIVHVSPWDMWIDPSANSLTDARWWVRRTVMPLRELKDDKRYFNTVDLEADSVEFTTQDGRLNRNEAIQELNGAEDYVTVYDYYDSEQRLMITFTDNSNLPLRWIEDVAPMVVQMMNHPIPNSPWHMGETEQVRALQDELNKTRSQMITHRRRNVVKYFYRSGALDDSGVDALQSGIVNQAIEVQSDEDFQNIIHTVSPPPLSADVYQMSEIIRNDIFEITGVNEYLRGIVPTQARTATEASIVEGSANVKVRDKLRQVEHAVRQAGQLIVDITAEAIGFTDFREMTLYLTGREAEAVLRAAGADVYNEQGQQLDARMNTSPSLFQGKYEVFVEKGSTELRDPQFREQKYKEMFMVLVNSSPMLGQLGVHVNIKRVLELWLEAAGVTDIDGVFQNPSVPDAQTQQLLQQYQQQGQQQGQGGPQAQTPTQAGPMGMGAQAPGVPNSFGVRPPSQPITEKNSNIMPPKL